MIWRRIKAELLANIEKAGITNKEFIRVLRRYNHQVYLCMESVKQGLDINHIGYSDPYLKAEDYLDILTEDFKDLVEKFDKVNGTDTLNLLDNTVNY